MLGSQQIAPMPVNTKSNLPRPRARGAS